MRKTSNVLKQGVGTLQAFQPIGYEEEKAIGGSLAIEVFDKFGGMHTDAQLQKYVTLVGRAVADVSDRPDIDYHFAVLNTNQPNAFATPGGYVFVSVGLLRLLENEAQLAGVLGHEIAHITQKHALKTLQRGKVLSGLSGLTMAAMDKDSGLFDNVINEVSNVLFTRGLDKELEFEADKFGTDFAYRMGYQPAGLKEFLKVLSGSRQSNGSILVYDPKSNRWKTRAPLPTARSGITSQTVNGKIYVFGGESGEGTFDENEAYNSKTDQWTSYAAHAQILPWTWLCGGGRENPFIERRTPPRRRRQQIPPGVYSEMIYRQLDSTISLGLATVLHKNEGS